MYKFLQKILIFTTLWFIISYIADFFVTNLIKKSNAREIVVWQDLFNSKIDADIIVLGSSRAVNHYNPLYMDSVLNLKCYNLGQCGKLVDMDFLRYKLYKKYNNTQPKIIIWDVFHNSLGKSDGFLDAILTPYIHEDRMFEALKQSDSTITYADKYLPLIRYWKKSYIFQYAFKNTFYDNNPYRGFSGEVRTWQPNGMENIKDGSLVCKREEKIIDEFINTIREMQSDGAEIFLVYSPFFCRGKNKVKELDDMVKLFDSIAENEHCYFINFISDSICLDSSFFYNSTHMNVEGAKQFSIKLSNIINSKIINK